MIKKRILFCVLLAESLLFSAQGLQAQKPVNPNATPEAVALLQQLYQQKGKVIFGGQHNYPHRLTRSSDSTLAITGKYPAVWGSDFYWFNRQQRDSMLIETVRQYHNGAIVTLMWHAPIPVPHHAKRGNSWTEMSDNEWNQLFVEGSDINLLFVKNMDKVAEGLKLLQDQHIPVLWRPFHEMNGIWFWWGNRQGPDGFARLWKMMYDRFTNYHKLNNLIWVWNANAPRDWKDDEAYAYELFYPGADYVDVLATDVYKNDYKQSHHDDLVKLANGKPIALGEVGEVPTPEILAQQPNWVWFMVWAEFNYRNNDPAVLKRLFNHERVITLDEMPKP